MCVCVSENNEEGERAGDREYVSASERESAR
jgi:hypothetical protein